MDDCPEDVHASAGEGDHSGVVAFTFAPFAVVESPAVLVAERAESRLVEDAFEALVAAVGSSQEAG